VYSLDRKRGEWHAMNVVVIEHTSKTTPKGTHKAVTKDYPSRKKELEARRQRA